MYMPGSVEGAAGASLRMQPVSLLCFVVMFGSPFVSGFDEGWRALFFVKLFVLEIKIGESLVFSQIFGLRLLGFLRFWRPHYFWPSKSIPIIPGIQVSRGQGRGGALFFRTEWNPLSKTVL